MYNGIGLRTVRGTATNGFVQRNLSFVKPAMVRAKTGKSDQDWGSAVPKARKACAEIQAHDRKRQIEVKLLEFQEELEAKGLSEAEIEARLELKREELTKELERRESAAVSPVATVGAVLADKGAAADSWRAAQHLPAPGTSGVKTYMDRKQDGQEEYYPGVERDRARRERFEKRRIEDKQREDDAKDRQRAVERRDREDRRRSERDDRKRSRSRDRSGRDSERARDRKGGVDREGPSRDRKRSTSRDRRRRRSPSSSSSSSSGSSSSGSSSGSSSSSASSRSSSSRSRSSSRRNRRDRR